MIERDPSGRSPQDGKTFGERFSGTYSSTECESAPYKRKEILI